MKRRAKQNCTMKSVATMWWVYRRNYKRLLRYFAVFRSFRVICWCKFNENKCAIRLSCIFNMRLLPSYYAIASRHHTVVLHSSSVIMSCNITFDFVWKPSCTWFSKRSVWVSVWLNCKVDYIDAVLCVATTFIATWNVTVN